MLHRAEDLLERITVFEDPKITVWCYPGKRLIHHQMHAYCYNAPFRAALTAGTDAMIQHGANRWLSDDRLNGPLSPDDEEWATKTWFPRTRSAGWKYWAMVQPTQVLGQLNVGRFVKMYRELGIAAQMFSKLEPAQAWIEAPDPDSKVRRR